MENIVREVIVILLVILIVLLAGKMVWATIAEQKDFQAITSQLKEAGFDCSTTSCELYMPYHIEHTLKMSYEDFVYDIQVKDSSFWVPVPVSTGKNTVVIPVPIHYTDKTKIQKVPVEDVTFEEIFKIGEGTGVLYYDDRHIFVPLQKDNMRFVVVYTLSDKVARFYKIADIRVEDDGITFVLAPK